MKLTPSERETIIIFDEEAPYATIQTYNTKLKNKLIKLCSEHEYFVRIGEEDDYGCMDFRVPKGYVTISSPRRISDEDRKSRSKRMSTIQNSVYGSK